jgi:hypothetical protein
MWGVDNLSTASPVTNTPSHRVEIGNGTVQLGFAMRMLLYPHEVSEQDTFNRGMLANGR